MSGGAPKVLIFSYLDFYFPLTFLSIAMLVVGGCAA
ncbi:hypothetical protein DSM104299_04144 [Baekduia alba]|nr:hypothetical protein DSM104299_04144 [Baekduia alba]